MQFHPWTKNGIGPIVLFIKSPERPDLFWRSSPSSCRMHNSLLQWSHRKQFYERNNKAWEMKSTRMLQLAITALYSDLGFKPTALLSFRLSAPSLNDHMFADSNGDGCVCVSVCEEKGGGGVKARNSMWELAAWWCWESKLARAQVKQRRAVWFPPPRAVFGKERAKGRPSIHTTRGQRRHHVRCQTGLPCFPVHKTYPLLLAHWKLICA